MWGKRSRRELAAWTVGAFGALSLAACRPVLGQDADPVVAQAAEGPPEDVPTVSNRPLPTPTATPIPSTPTPAPTQTPVPTPRPDTPNGRLLFTHEGGIWQWSPDGVKRLTDVKLPQIEERYQKFVQLTDFHT